MHCINLYFECEAAGEIALNEESAEHRWVSEEEMARLNVVFRNDDDRDHAIESDDGASPAGRYLYCLNGSHMAMYDDQAAYFDGLIGFIRDVDAAPR